MITEKDTQKCMEIFRKDAEVCSRCSHLSYYPLVIAKAEGSVITDIDGNQFIDFLSSASSLNMGSALPEVAEAMKAQIDSFSQYTPAYTYNEKTTAYAERLVSVYPGGVKAKVCFGNCGSDANDAAVKFSRAYTGRQKIIVFLNGYHGSTYGSASLTTCSINMRDKMGPFLPEIYAFPFYSSDMDDELVENECLRDIKRACLSYLSTKEIAAVIIEPVQGDAGILPAHPVFMKKLYDWCRENDILFISEEVQQGFWRTGKFFGIENYEGIIPDGIIMGKSIGAGTPLGAFMGREEIMDCLPAPAHLFTLGGNPLSCAAGIAAFDYYQTDEFQQLLAGNIELITRLADELKKKYPDIIDFRRSIGMSMGIGIKPAFGAPAEDVTYKILYRAYQRGLIVISLAGRVLRIQPPLNIKPEELTRGFEIIAESIEDFKKGDISDSVFAFRAGW